MSDGRKTNSGRPSTPAKRKFFEVAKLIKAFQNPVLEEELTGAWEFLVAIGKREGVDLYEIEMTSADIKISLVFTKFILEDKVDFSPEEVYSLAGCNLRAYSAWEFMNELGRFCKRVDKIVGRERMQGQTRKVQKKLVEWTEAGDKKAAEMFLRNTGQYDGTPEAQDGVFVEVVENYDEAAIEKHTAQVLALAPKVVVPELTPSQEAEMRLKVGINDSKQRKREGKKGYFNHEIKTAIDQENVPRDSVNNIVWQKAKAQEVAGGQ